MAPPAAAYKPIQPAPAKRERSGVSSGARSGPSSIISGGERQQTKRLKAVTQACHTCRRFKARCDGARPRCGGCASKDKPCGYEGEEGQSRQAAKQARLEALEKLMSALQYKSSEEAGELLQRIRTGDDPAAVLSGVDSGTESQSPPTVAASVTESASVSFSVSGSGSGSGSSNAPSSSAPRPSIAGSRAGSDDSRARTSSSSTLVSPSAGSKLPDPIALSLSALPNAKSMRACVESFFSSAGKLFHVFSQDQVMEHHKTMFGFDGRPRLDQKVSICIVSIVAAIGAQYNLSEFDEGTDEVLWSIARLLFADVLEFAPLPAIKVCTLLAMYNINNKSTIALAYIETGLTMCKRQSENTGVCHPDQESQQEWVEFRHTWRTLIFFNSWLTSTLGYISGTDDSAFDKVMPLAETEADIYTKEIGEIVQAEMTKISLLKAGILKNRLAFQEITTGGMDGIVKELEEWHSRLPDDMRLGNLLVFRAHVRWSIYHVHLLYLGAFMLVYRRLAAQCITLYKPGNRNLLEIRNRTVIKLVKQGVDSARDSARILRLLHDDRGIFKRCWLVIFQTHTSCVVILHSAAQKILHKHPEAEWREDLNRAQLCLEVLRFCGTIDPVALRFLIRLSSIYEKLVDLGSESRTVRQRIEDWVPPPPDLSESKTSDTQLTSTATENTDAELDKYEYLLTIPTDANPELAKLSINLLYALCRPWGDPDDRSVTDAATPAPCKPEMLDGKLPAEMPNFFRSELDWNRVSAPFSWDTTSMGIGNVASKATASILPPRMGPEALFLGSEAPNGWSPAHDVEIYEDERS
ncbi:hypothetical protein QBC40DRAFT_47121 [Triangularia verruculosa]|uniref:Zn(2)-C6 fungal-type domain-containing protein n=1 Tax=Triangularia verruculosa TaxID=2587418 RepID=A0AAN6XK14_9PEZI|nr:hypothetical protein QBC40DRAFT_47121 [Triangularia verruculosa]